MLVDFIGAILEFCPDHWAGVYSLMIHSEIFSCSVHKHLNPKISAYDAKNFL